MINETLTKKTMVQQNQQRIIYWYYFHIVKSTNPEVNGGWLS